MSRNLLNRSYESLGLDQKLWISQETGGYGEKATGGLIPLAAGAVEHITFDLGFDIPREDSAARSGRSVVTRLSGKKESEWKFEGYIVPGIPDSLGNPTLPPLHPLLLSAFGNVDLTDPTKIVYKLSTLSDKSFRVIEEKTHASRIGVGLVADKLSFKLPGDGKAQLSMEGFGQDVFAAGEAKLAQAVTGANQTASKVIQDLTYTADNPGAQGNDISIKYNGGGTAGSEVVSVVGKAISVQIETGVSTATQIKSAVDAFPAAAALVNVTISGVGGNAQTIFASPINLEGGLLTTELKVSTEKGQQFEPGALLDVISAGDGNTASNPAKKIVAVGIGVNKDIITVDTALAAASLNDFVIGHAPVTYLPITSENALLGLKGSVSFAGLPNLEAEAISVEISVTNNFTKKDFIYGTSKTTGYVPDKRREVMLKLELLLNPETFSNYMRNKKYITEDVTIKLEPQDIPAPAFTSGVGRTWTFRLPRVEFNIPPLEEPSDQYVVLALEGKALATDINNLDNEMTLTIQ